jgi:hypothetical protein
MENQRPSLINNVVLLSPRMGLPAIRTPQLLSACRKDFSQIGRSLPIPDSAFRIRIVAQDLSFNTARTLIVVPEYRGFLIN